MRSAAGSLMVTGNKKSGAGHLFWVVSSAGRAVPLQGIGQRFDPVTTHQMRASSNG